MDGFWMEVERIQQRDELREEDGSGGEGRPPEGEEPGGAAGRKGGARCRGHRGEVQARIRTRKGCLSGTVAASSSLVSLLHPCPLPS